VTYDRRVANALRDRRIQALIETTDAVTGEHPNRAAHETLGLATKGELTDHAATPHGGDAGPHTHADYATDADMADHAGTAHGLSIHALDGAYHSDSEALPTPGQRNALVGTSGTPGEANRYVTDQDARLTDDRAPTEHEHAAPDLSTYATLLDLETHEGAPHGATDPHDHDAQYAPIHAHDYAATGHGHTLTESDIPAAIARDTEVSSAIDAHVAAATHGGGTHPAGSHVTPQSSIANVTRSGNASTQTANLQNKVDEILAALRGAGVIGT
jgi:hypothetical protein